MAYQAFFSYSASCDTQRDLLKFVCTGEEKSGTQESEATGLVLGSRFLAGLKFKPKCSDIKSSISQLMKGGGVAFD